MGKNLPPSPLIFLLINNKTALNWLKVSESLLQGEVSIGRESEKEKEETLRPFCVCVGVCGPGIAHVVGT